MLRSLFQIGKKRRGCGQGVLTSVAGTGSTSVWGSALVVSFSFEVVRPRGCFCDGSRVYPFPGSAKKRMKRLKCACRTKKAPGLGRKCSQTKGSGSGWILGVGHNHQREVHFLDIEAFPWQQQPSHAAFPKHSSEPSP